MKFHRLGYFLQVFILAPFLLNLFSVSALAAETTNSVSTQSIYEPSWQWTDEHGKKDGLSQYKGTALILTMTYTSCSMSCPTTIRTLKKVSEDLGKKSIKANFVIISFDTQNDTVRNLANYKKKWKLPDNWHFLTGTEADLSEIEKFLNFKVSYDRIDDHYTHDKKIFIIDREGKIKKTFEDWDSDFRSALLEK